MGGGSPGCSSRGTDAGRNSASAARAPCGCTRSASNAGYTARSADRARYPVGVGGALQPGFAKRLVRFLVPLQWVRMVIERSRREPRVGVRRRSTGDHTHRISGACRPSRLEGRRPAHAHRRTSDNQHRGCPEARRGQAWTEGAVDSDAGPQIAHTRAHPRNEAGGEGCSCGRRCETIEASAGAGSSCGTGATPARAALHRKDRGRLRRSVEQRGLERRTRRRHDGHHRRRNGHPPQGGSEEIGPRTLSSSSP